MSKQLASSFVSFLRRPGFARFAVPAIVALCATPVQADILVVAADGSGDFLNLPQAAFAAHDGDTLLVKPGTYDSVVLYGGKALNLIANANVHVNGYIAVVDCPAGKTVLISGFETQGKVGSAGPIQGHGFVAINNGATVRVQNCHFTGAAGDPDGWQIDDFQFSVTGHAAGWHAALLSGNSGAISFNDCSFDGGAAAYMVSYPEIDCGCTYGEPGGDGIHISASTVALTDCSGEAGYGAEADREGGFGGAGIRVVSGQAVVAGCEFEGGDGGSAWDYLGPVFGGDGGDGVSADLATDTSLLDNELVGGEGGGSFSPGAPGADGLPLGGPGAADAHLYPGTARHLGITAPAYVGGLVGLTLDGQPGDLFLLQISTGHGWLPSAKFQGVFSIGLPALSLGLGVLPPSGHLQLFTPVPAIAPLSSLNLFLQAIGGTPADASLTGEALLLLVDPAGL